MADAPAARATTALALLVEQSHTVGGFLCRLDGRVATRRALHAQTTLPSALLVDFVGAYLDELLDEVVDTTRDDAAGSALEAAETHSWRAPDGRRYRAVVLSHYVGSRLVISGVAMLDIGGGAFAYPAQLVAELSEVANTTRWITFGTH